MHLVRREVSASKGLKEGYYLSPHYSKFIGVSLSGNEEHGGKLNALLYTEGWV